MDLDKALARLEHLAVMQKGSAAPAEDQYALQFVRAALKETNYDWQKLHGGDDQEGYLQVDEGNTYLFAIQLSNGAWDYFVDAIVWDSETDPHWSEGQSGWEINDVQWFCELHSPETAPAQ